MNAARAAGSRLIRPRLSRRQPTQRTDEFRWEEYVRVAPLCVPVCRTRAPAACGRDARVARTRVPEVRLECELPELPDRPRAHIGIVSRSRRAGRRNFRMPEGQHTGYFRLGVRRPWAIKREDRPAAFAGRSKSRLPGPSGPRDTVLPIQAVSYPTPHHLTAASARHAAGNPRNQPEIIVRTPGETNAAHYRKERSESPRKLLADPRLWMDSVSSLCLNSKNAWL
jgi:hypothetical protein